MIGYLQRVAPDDVSLAERPMVTVQLVVDGSVGLRDGGVLREIRVPGANDRR